MRTARAAPHVRRTAHEPRLARPFCPIEPALAEFPMKTWARISARVLGRLTLRSLARGDPAGSRALTGFFCGLMPDMFRMGLPGVLTCVSWASFRQKY